MGVDFDASSSIAADVETNHIARGSGSGLLTGSAYLSYSGNTLVVRADAGGSTAALINAANDAVAAGSHALIRVTATNGDAMYVARSTSSAYAWTFGVDTSESSRFAWRVSNADTGGVLGDADVLRITTAGAMTVLGASLDQVVSSSGATVAMSCRNSSNTASSAARITAEVAGASGGNALFSAAVSGVTTWTWGIDNANSDRFALNPSTALGTNDVLVIGTNGLIGIGGAPNPSYNLALIAGGLFGVLGTSTGARAGADISSGGGTQISLSAYGSAQGGTILGETKAGLSSIEAYPAAGNGFHIGVSGDTFIGLTTNSVRQLTVSTAGVVCGSAALATTATAGFLYVAACAGTPTGAAAAIAGRVPIVIDSTNHKLYFYSGGAWRDAGP